MIISHQISVDDLAEAIIGSAISSEDIVALFLRVDEIRSDSEFTDLVLTAFESRWYEIMEIHN